MGRGSQCGRVKGKTEKTNPTEDSDMSAIEKKHEKATGRFSDPAVHGNRAALNIAEVMERVRAAHSCSPIIVYLGAKQGTYTTAFASTVRGRQDLEKGFGSDGARVLGAWHGRDAESTMRAVLTLVR